MQDDIWQTDREMRYTPYSKGSYVLSETKSRRRSTNDPIYQKILENGDNALE